jgi:uncharacterized protein
MKIELSKKPKNPIIINGFPGFGLVGTIASEFLLDHLKCEQIGRITDHNMPAMIAVHEGKVVEPIGIFYNKKYNIVIIHTVTGTQGLEWKITDAILDVAKQLSAKEIISLEGIGSMNVQGEPKPYCYSKNEKVLGKFKDSGCEKLKEGIIMGATGILLLSQEKALVSVIFAETHSKLPDSKAAAKVIEVLDKYLDLEVDYKPLLKQAEKFEDKLKGLMEKGQQMVKETDKKKLSYVG